MADWRESQRAAGEYGDAMEQGDLRGAWDALRGNTHRTGSGDEAPAPRDEDGGDVNINIYGR